MNFNEKLYLSLLGEVSLAINNRINDEESDCLFENKGLNYSYLKMSWITGKDSGGNCWGGSSSYEKNEQKAPSLEEIDELLLYLQPEFTLSSYKELQKSLAFDSYRTSEYYGNGVYYDSIQLSALDLYVILEKAKISLTDEKLTSALNYFKPRNQAHHTKFKY